MNTQDIMMGARVLHVRELKAELKALKAENAALRAESASLSAHFDLALAAAADLKDLSAEASQLVVDGWNLILGATKAAHSRAELVEKVKARLAEGAYEKAWIVFDGDRENVENVGDIRISYTGGAGKHRADKFILAYLRMARYLGLAERITIWTHDKDFRKTAVSIGAKVI